MFDKKIDEELLAHAFLELLFLNSFEAIGDLSSIEEETPMMKIEALKRKIVSQFSFEEAKDIFERLKQGEKGRQLFEIKFAEKGIQLPQTEKELDEFLAKPSGLRH